MVASIHKKILYSAHVRSWSECRRCHLHKGREQVVLARGQVPCDVLFLGEAPGESENVLGRPFVGPAGKLLDLIVRRAIPAVVVNGKSSLTDFRELGFLSCAFTNLVACMPCEGGEKATEPDDAAIKACTPRLQEFVRLADPRLIVCVGSLARDWLDPKYRGSISFHREIPMAAIRHPASILRMSAVQMGLEIQRCVVTIANAWENFNG